MVMNDKLYNILKKVALVILPALATLWLGLAKIWGFPYAEEIGGTITLLDCFLVSVLGLSTHFYNKSLKAEAKEDLKDNA